MEALQELCRIMKIQDPESRDFAFRGWREKYLVVVAQERVFTKQELESAWAKDHKERLLARELGLACVQECGKFTQEPVRGNPSYPATLQIKFHSKVRLEVVAFRAKARPLTDGSG